MATLTIKEYIMNQKKHGGPRKGAGRPKLKTPVKVITIRVPVNLLPAPPSEIVKAWRKWVEKAENNGSQ